MSKRSRSMTVILTLLLMVGARAGAGATPEGAGEDPPKISEISHGEPFELQDAAVPGKVTLFQFTSRHCVPCQRIKKPLTELVRTDPRVYYRLVDIDRPGSPRIDVDSPVARQYGFFGQGEGIPWFAIVDANGKVDAQGRTARDKVDKWLAEKGYRY